MRTGQLLTATVSALLIGASACQAACDKTDKVTAVWLPIMQTTAYYVALEEKLFEKACIEVVSTKMESPNQIIDAYETGEPVQQQSFGLPSSAGGLITVYGYTNPLEGS